MVTMITLHMLSEQNREKAVWVLTTNTELARKAKGFISRNIYFCVDDPLKGYSITTWESRKDLENFKQNPDRPPLKSVVKGGAINLETDDGPVLMFTSTDTDIFEVLDVA
jgi:heme-degrading monooxygenase HmoA